ncbi:unnamed protein product [Acanthoscelides obtectus]|uniref:Uncharacterized protein n=1 Tax=Acanthoscelides obtectus TaxID=200917 RepID=A0A9P0L2Z3_ACAOB|nr:unnamed protein product [Acanthoscelides obtectus]CAK1648270.1 hypothetical protein AOBTE_LOCUS15631 [Acanthoscelides obtectus]
MLYILSYSKIQINYSCLIIIICNNTHISAQSKGASFSICTLERVGFPIFIS